MYSAECANKSALGAFAPVRSETSATQENLLLNQLSSQQLAEELHWHIIRKFGKWKVYSSFKDNIRGTDLADTQLIGKFDKEFRFLLCVIDIYDKYAWSVPLKGRKGNTVSNAFQKQF